MKLKLKTFTFYICALILTTATVLGTFSYLTDKDEAVNTFTVGKVDITLDETAVDTNGNPIPNADRVKENQYHLIPGKTYVKDPMITVAKNSEEAFVRMLVTFNKLSELDAVFANNGADLTSIFDGYDHTKWIYEGTTKDVVANTVTYEFRYFKTVDGTFGALDPLFDKFTLPGEINSDELNSISGLEITVIGHAIQKSGFDTADAAWVEFAAQINN